MQLYNFNLALDVDIGPTRRLPSCPWVAAAAAVGSTSPLVYEVICRLPTPTTATAAAAAGPTLM